MGDAMMYDRAPAIRSLTCGHGTPRLLESSILHPWCAECEDTVAARFFHPSEGGRVP